MKDLNEQIIFFKDICLEDSYLNEDLSASPATTDLVNMASALQNVFSPKDPESESHKEDVEHEAVDEKAEPIKIVSKEPFNLTLRPSEYKIIPLKELFNIQAERDVVKIKYVRVNGILVGSQKVFCAPYEKFENDEIVKELSKKLSDFETQDFLDVDKFRKSIGETCQKLEEQAKECIFLFAMGPCDEVEIRGSLVIGYEKDNKEYEYTCCANDGKPIGKVRVEESTDKDKSDGDGDRIEYIKPEFNKLEFWFPTGENVLYLSNNDPIDLKEFLYLEKGDVKIKYAGLSEEIRQKFPIGWNIVDVLTGGDKNKVDEAASTKDAEKEFNQTIKNVFTLDDGKLYIPKSSKESFNKLRKSGILDENKPSIDVVAYFKDATDNQVKSQANETIYIIDDKNSAQNFAVTTSEDETDPDFEADTYDIDCFVGKKQNMYIKIFPETALYEYYSVDVSVHSSDLFKLTSVKDASLYELEIDSSTYETFTEYEKADKKGSEDFKTIDFTLLRFKTDQSGDIREKKGKIAESRLFKKVVVNPVKLPENLEIVPATNDLQMNTSEQSISYKVTEKDDPKQLDITKIEPYNKLFGKDITIGAISANTDVLTANINSGSMQLKSVNSDNAANVSVYLYLTSNIDTYKPVETKELPEALQNYKNIISFAEIDVTICKIIRKFNIDVPPRPSCYDTLMAPMVAGKGGLLFGIRHYTTDPTREIDSTNNRSMSLLDSKNPVAFFSKIIGTYMGAGSWSAKNIGNKAKYRQSNASGRDYELRDMNNKKVNTEFKKRNASTWVGSTKESIEYEFDNPLYEASKSINAMKPQNDLMKCEDYFKEVYDNYTKALAIIYGDDTQKFHETIRSGVIRSFAENKMLSASDGGTFNPASAFTMLRNFIRAAAGALTTTGNDRIASFKKLGEDLKGFADNANETMVNKIEKAFAGILGGNVKGLVNADGEKSSVPLKQAELKNLWFGYYKKLQRDATTFQNKFINSEAFTYTRKILNLTIPDILALDLVSIATILNKAPEDALEGITPDKYAWENLFNFTKDPNDREEMERMRSKKEEAEGSLESLIDTNSNNVCNFIKKNQSQISITDKQFEKFAELAKENKGSIIYDGDQKSPMKLFITFMEKLQKCSNVHDKIQYINDFFSKKISLKSLK